MDNNRLDEKVKKTLSSFEVPYNASDWVQMESMLDVVPKHSPLGRSYTPVVLIASLVIGAAFLLYTVFKSSETPEKINTIYTPPVVKEINIEKPKPVVTHSAVTNPVLPPAKKEVSAPVKTVATHTAAVEPVMSPTKKDLKTKEKKVVEKKLTEKKKVERKTTDDKMDTPVADSPNKEGEKTTLSGQDNKVKLFKKALEKNKKAIKQVQKPEMKQTESDTVHIDDENDSNRNRKALNVNTSTGTADSLKKNLEKTGTKVIKKESKKSKKGKKTSSNDSLNVKNAASGTVDPETIKKNTDQQQKDSLKTGN